MRTQLLLRTTLLFSLAAPPLLAQDPSQPATPDPSAAAFDPPPAAARPVIRTARLTFFTGDLQVQRVDNTAPDSAPPGEPGAAHEAGPSDTAALNMPIPGGSRLLTGDDAQAEIEFEDGSLLRLTPHTVLSLDALTLEDKPGSQPGNPSAKVAHTSITLLSGLAYFELRRSPVATYTISAGGILASPAENVTFRIAFEQPPAIVAVLSGSLTVNAESDSDTAFTATVKAGESLRPDPEDPTRYFLNPQLAENTWDTWNQSRDDQATGSASTRTAARDAYAGSQGYGWSDLDASGTWYTMPGPDGAPTQIWQPAAAAQDPALLDTADPAGDSPEEYPADSFDPYGDGAWVWSGNGYTWASAYTWGWLPYRCGRWNWYRGFGWAWTPNRFCLVWGFGGEAGGVNIGVHPLPYRPIRKPRRNPNPVHPIVRVHDPAANPRRGSGEPHPVARGPIKIAGIDATPLRPLEPSLSAASSAPGQALYRDYPVESVSKKPILGNIPSPATLRPAQTPSSADPTLLTGWIARQPNPQESIGATAPARIVRNPAAGGTAVRPAPQPGHAAPPARAAEPSHSAAPAAPAKSK